MPQTNTSVAIGWCTFLKKSSVMCHQYFHRLPSFRKLQMWNLISHDGGGKQIENDLRNDSAPSSAEIMKGGSTSPVPHTPSRRGTKLLKSKDNFTWSIGENVWTQQRRSNSRLEKMAHAQVFHNFHSYPNIMTATKLRERNERAICERWKICNPKFQSENL
jgi:hypothetical protein